MPTHYSASEKEGITYCGSLYKLREFPDMKARPLFSDRHDHVTCKKCQTKLKQESVIAERLKAYLKKIESEMSDSRDDYVLGYQEAIFNLCGEYNNGHCEDCIFSYETEITDFESCQPEAVMNCSLDRCWIEEVKKIIGSR